MANPRDRILIVENDPLIFDLVGRQALQAAGYQVILAQNAADALTCAFQTSPDVIIADLSLPGLSGKDLLVALNSQGITAPVIVLAQKGQEAAIMQTFRLGAADYLIWPVREPEVISAVERLLHQTHERRERDRLTQQFEQTNNELQLRVHELTTIFSIGKAVTTVIDQSALFEKIVEGAVSVTQADLGWFLLLEEKKKQYSLVAQRNLSASFLAHHSQPLDEGICSLISMSGEILSIYGEQIKRFKVSCLGQSALIAPIKVQEQVVGLLVVMRKQGQAFSISEKHLLEAVADYASISLVNARLFRSVEERARSLQTLVETSQMAEKIDAERLEVVNRELTAPLDQSRDSLEKLIKNPVKWSAEQRQLISTLRENINQLSTISTALASSAAAAQPSDDLKQLVQQSINRLEPFARQRHLSIVAEAPVETIVLSVQPAVIAHLLDGLLTNAIKVSKPGGQVCIQIEKIRTQQAHILISDCGPGIDPRLSAHLFDKNNRPNHRKQPFGGIGIGLPLIQEIVTSLRGKIWVESKPEKGACFHVTLPLGKQVAPDINGARAASPGHKSLGK